ncbi:hypothetical protein B0F90DRAFT_1364267 [Multifurca ochricompacta]|uniref:Secreted protein n=1 Tax=Multifurca ochricompacta TaxID=376703 RepID=A0AAD4M6L7_9AGAM|nr:hypothetical protein B0F90DRAFT_1364267 [Multifurca ochricompacta]
MWLSSLSVVLLRLSVLSRPLTKCERWFRTIYIPDSLSLHLIIYIFSLPEPLAVPGLALLLAQRHLEWKDGVPYSLISTTNKSILYIFAARPRCRRMLKMEMMESNSDSICYYVNNIQGIQMQTTMKSQVGKDQN